MQAVLRARGEEVRRPGVYIGFLEWIAWGFIEHRRVLMLFGSEVVDVSAVFAPGLPDPGSSSTCHVAAVQRTEDGSLHSAEAAS